MHMSYPPSMGGHPVIDRIRKDRGACKEVTKFVGEGGFGQGGGGRIGRGRGMRGSRETDRFGPRDELKRFFDRVGEDWVSRSESDSPLFDTAMIGK